MHVSVNTLGLLPSSPTRRLLFLLLSEDSGLPLFLMLADDQVFAPKSLVSLVYDTKVSESGGVSQDISLK